MRKVLLFVLILTAVFQLPTTSEAKGMSDRIVISSPALSEDIIVEDESMLSALYLMAKFADGEIDEPDDIDVGYELKRQSSHDGTYTGFDIVYYYPSTSDKSGYVYYLGIVDGSSTLDRKWYDVRPEAELAMQYILSSQHLTDYLIAYQTNGQFQLLDPVTLETSYTLDTGLTDWAYAFNGDHSLDGNRLFFQRNSGKHIEEYYVDLATREVCSTGNHALISPSIDGQHLIFQVGNTIEKRDAQSFELVDTIDNLFPDDNHHSLSMFTSGSYVNAIGVIWDNTARSGEMLWLDMLKFDIIDRIELNFERPVSSVTIDPTYGELFASDGFDWAKWYIWDNALDFARPVRPTNGMENIQDAGVTLALVGVHHGEPIYYPRLGRYWKWDTTKAEEVTGGITVSRREYAKEEISYYQPDIPFQHVIMQGNSLYAIEVPLEGDTATIYRLDVNSGEILNSGETTVDVHRLGYGRLDTTTLSESPVTFSECSAKLPFAPASSSSAAVVPPTATPTN